MKNILFAAFIGAFFLSQQIFAADKPDPFGYCHQYLAAPVFGQFLPLFNESWSVDESGHLQIAEKSLKQQFFSNYEKVGNQTTIQFNPLAGPVKLVLKTDDKGKLLSVKNFFTGAGLTNNSYVEHTFQNINGICVPDKSQVFRQSKADGHIKKETILSRGFCQALAEFKKKTPQAFQCSCGTDQTRKELSGLFGKHNVNVLRDSDGMDEKEASPANAPGIVLASLFRLKDCAVSGLMDSLKDKKIASKQADQSSSSEGSAAPASAGN